MEERIRKELEQEQPTVFHSALLKHCKALIDMSRMQMSQEYKNWDLFDQTYRGERPADKEDCKAKTVGAPTKLVVPITFSQVQTAVAYCFSVFFQKERMVHLVGVGPEDHESAKVGESLVERDFRQNIFDTKLYQFLVDVFRFGLGIFKVGWVREEHLTEVEQDTAPASIFGRMMNFARKALVKKRSVKFLGNRLYNISPYRFYPDTRLPLSRFQEGEFCGSEDEYSRVSLLRMEQEGSVAGMKFVKAFTHKDLSNRGETRFSHMRAGQEDFVGKVDIAQSQGIDIVTECQVTLVPSKFDMDDGKPLGKSEFPEKWNVWYVNDQRVVKAEPLGYAHGVYTYSLAEISPDQHRLLNEGLAEMVDPLQSVISWFINSHITSVRKVVQNRLVVDPEGVEMSDLDGHTPVIRVRSGYGRIGIDKFVHQLQTADVTANHIADVEYLHKLVQITTGVNDNALGQFHTGRRSATEARAVTGAAAARLNLLARLIWKSSLEPMVSQMLANFRQDLDVATYVQVIGEGKGVEPYAQFKKVTKADLAATYDFEVYDGTSPSDRLYQAQTLQEVLVALMGKPEFLLYLGYDPRKILREILELRGIRNPERLQMQPDQLAAVMQTMGTGGQASGETGVGEPSGNGSTPPNGRAVTAPGLSGGVQDFTGPLVG